MPETVTPSSGPSTGRPRSLLELVQDLKDEMVGLARQEIELTRTEYAQKTRVMTRGAVRFAVAGGTFYAAVLALLAALCVGVVELLNLIPGLGMATAVWLGPLVVGVVLALIAWGMYSWAKSSIKDESLLPERTVHTLKEDKEWIQEKMH